MMLVGENQYTEIYTALSQERVIFLTEDLTKEVASLLCGLLIYYNALDTQKDIHLFIHTSGGDASALTSIYNVMCLIEAPISTIGVGKIYSAGVFLLAAGTKGKRYMFPNAEVMIHGIQSIYPEIPSSDTTDATNYFNYLESFNKRILKILSRHTGQPISKILQDSKRDLYLDAKSALKYGIIDEIF